MESLDRIDGIVMEQICHRYKDARGRSLEVLRGLNLTLSPGECVALTGESGSGKSTVARLLLGFEKPSSGRIYLDGEEMAGWSNRTWQKRRRFIQGVFQDSSGSLNPYRSVYHTMEEGLKNLTGQTPVQRKKEIYGLMELFNLESKILTTPPRKLSGGEQRRVSLVRALALRPRYLVLDEVTGGLDLLSADAVLTTLERYREEFGCTYLFITHDLACAGRLADRILVLQKGRLMAQGERQLKETNSRNKGEKK